MIRIDYSKTTFTSIAILWEGIDYRVKGSGGMESDFKIWYRNNDTVKAKILLTSSTNKINFY